MRPIMVTLLRPAPQRTTPAVVLVYILWILVWFEPDWFLAARGAGVLVRIFPLLLLPAMAMIAFNGRREAFYWPFVALLAIHVLWLPFAINSGFVMVCLKRLIHYLVVIALTVSVIDTGRRAELLLKLFLLHFIWFAVQGIPSGFVWWHIVLGNQDSYGPLMVMGLGFSYYFASGTTSTRYRILASVSGLICMAGLVLTFTRGAMLALAVVILAIWIRTPRKLAFLGYSVVALAIGLAVIQVAYPNGEFWERMQSIGDGTTAGTGETRWILWKLAGELFLVHPILGVGPGNFGTNAAEYSAGQGNLGNIFNDPSMLYMWFLHNDYVQVLVEQGLVGVVVMGAILVGFNRRLRWLRTAEARRRWHEATGGFIDLRHVSLGLEVAMIGYLANAVFYGHIYLIHWFWSLVMFAHLLARVTRTESIAVGRRGHAQVPTPRARPVTRPVAGTIA